MAPDEEDTDPIVDIGITPSPDDDVPGQDPPVGDKYTQGQPSRAYEEEVDEPDGDEDVAGHAEEVGDDLEEAAASLEDDAGESPDDTEAVPPPKPSNADASQPAPSVNRSGTRSVGANPGHEPPSDETHTSADAPGFEEVEGRQEDMESFGEKLQAFNEAGGAEGASGEPNIGSGEDEEEGQRNATEQLGESALGFANQAKDMLTEYGRRLDEITRSLEAERL